VKYESVENLSQIVPKGIAAANRMPLKTRVMIRIGSVSEGVGFEIVLTPPELPTSRLSRTNLALNSAFSDHQSRYIGGFLEADFPEYLMDQLPIL
jgi:hypothetical protein